MLVNGKWSAAWHPAQAMDSRRGFFRLDGTLGRRLSCPCEARGPSLILGQHRFLPRVSSGTASSLPSRGRQPTPLQCRG